MRYDLDSYVPVHERIEKFYARFPQGRILTSVVEHNQETGFVLMRSEVYREPDDTMPAATGHAYEVQGGNGPQATSYIEVCETSSVGRALALLGFEVKRGIASREEMQKASRQQTPQSVVTALNTPPVKSLDPAGKLDNDILAARDILGKSNEDLTGYTQKKFGGEADWWRRAPEQKDWLLAFLNRKVDEQVAEAS